MWQSGSFFSTDVPCEFRKVSRRALPTGPGNEAFHSHQAYVRSPLTLLVRRGVQELPSLPRAHFSCRESTLLSLQEVNILKCQLGDKLRIELDTEPTVDLSRVLDDMRCQYEAMVETNRRDVEQWFQAQVRRCGRAGQGSRLPPGQGGDHVSVFQSEGISLQATSCSEELQCCQSEILELRCTVNALEGERQAQHNLVSSYARREDPAWLPLP